MNKFKTLLEKIRSNNINWKSKKTIAAVTVAAAVLFAALTGVTALTVRHINTEPTQKTTLPFAEEVTAATGIDEVSTTADAANTAPTSTTTPAQPASANNSKTSASSNNSTGSKTTGKTGSSSNSGGASHSSGTSSKPSSGSNNSSAKPSGGSTAKPTTTKPVTTTQPAKKEFAMTKQEIIDYASNYIESTYHCKYNDGFGKDVPGTGYNAPSVIPIDFSAEHIKDRLRGAADATYLPNGWYKVYVEIEDEDTMRVYMFY